MHGLIAASFLAITAPNIGPITPDCGAATRVQGETLHCCTQPNGMRCCAKTLDEDGKVTGCGCSG